jgi:uncharacterized protein YndB with AHSA1/START domain
MKWVLYILGALVALIALACLVLFVLGLRADSDRLQSSITIQRPPAEVWPWLYEGEKSKQWVSWLVEVKRDPGPPVPGSHFTWTMHDANNGNREMIIEATTLSVEPQRQLVLKVSTAGVFDGTSTYTLTDLGGATRLDSDSHYTFDSGFARLMTPLIMPSARKKMNSDLAHLRELVEKQPVTAAAGAAK